MIHEPTPLTPAPSPAPARPRISRLRIGLVVVACLALAIPVVATLAANSSSPSGQGFQAGAAPAPHLKGPKDFKGPRHGHITITAIDGSQISLATEDGWTRTIVLGSDATVMRSDATIAVSGLKVGDEVRIRQVRNADGTFTVVELRVVLPHLRGEVTAVGDTSLTIKLHDGSTRVITLTAETTYRLGRNDATKADLTLGADVAVEGTAGAGDAFTASSVRVRLPHLGGVVSAISGSTITITRGGREGAVAVTIHVGSSTDYTVPSPTGPVAGALKDVAVGMRISAEGTLRDDGSLDASSVDVHPPKPGHGAPPAP